MAVFHWVTLNISKLSGPLLAQEKSMNLCGHFPLGDFLSITKQWAFTCTWKRRRKEKYLQPFYTMILAGPPLMHLQMSSGPDLNWKSDIIITPYASSVYLISRQQMMGSGTWAALCWAWFTPSRGQSSVNAKAQTLHGNFHRYVHSYFMCHVLMHGHCHIWPWLLRSAVLCWVVSCCLIWLFHKMFDFHKTERLIQSIVQGNSLFNVMGQEIIEYGPSVTVTRLAGWLSVCGKSLNFSVLFVFWNTINVIKVKLYMMVILAEVML